MYQILPALRKSVSTLRRWSLWRCLLPPFVVALAVFTALLYWGYAPCVNLALQIPPFRWVVNGDQLWLALLLSSFAIWALFSSMAYLIALLVAALLMRPLILHDVAGKDYPKLARMGQSNPKASLRNTLSAALGFTVGWMVTLVFLVIPGVGFILPLLLIAWLNRRVFAYDALVAFATSEEWQRIRRRNSRPLSILALMLSMLAHIPFFGLFVSGFAALAYTHYELEMLSQLRADMTAQASLLHVIQQADEP